MAIAYRAEKAASVSNPNEAFDTGTQLISAITSSEPEDSGTLTNTDTPAAGALGVCAPDDAAPDSAQQLALVGQSASGNSYLLTASASGTMTIGSGNCFTGATQNATPAATESLVSESFDEYALGSSPSGWPAVGSGISADSVTNSWSVSGTQSLAVSGTSTAAGQTIGFQNPASLPSQDYLVTAGQTYDYAGVIDLIRNDSPNQAFVEIAWRTATGAAVGYSVLRSPSGGAAGVYSLSGSAVAPAGAVGANIYVGVSANASGQTVQFDADDILFSLA